MKIAMIIDAWYPIVGGGQTHVLELSNHLVKNHGCEIHIYTRAIIDEDNKKHNQNEEYLDGKLKIIRVGPTCKFFNIFGRVTSLFTISYAIIRNYKKEKYNIIHAHVFLGAIIGKISSIFTKIPLILTIHGTMLTDANIKSINAYIEKKICFETKYDHIITVGYGYLKYPNINTNISVIPNGIDITKFDNIKNISKVNFFKILFVGRFDWQKGINYLLKGVKILKERNIDMLKQKKMQVHLIGYGYDIDKYKKIAQDYNILDYIIFRGKITGDDLIKEYKSSHIFILPSISEGDPITIKEAWTSNIAVIATKCNAPEYYVEDSIDGFLIDPKNPHQIADVIEMIIQLPQENLEKMGINGYNKIKEKYSWDKVSEQTYQVYKLYI